MDSNGREEKSYVQETQGFQFKLRLTWLYMMEGVYICRAPTPTDYCSCFWSLKNIADSTYSCLWYLKAATLTLATEGDNDIYRMIFMLTIGPSMTFEI